MKRFIPREKLGRKARKQLDSEQRATWTVSPVTKKVESKKLYSRKKRTHDRDEDYGMGFLWPVFSTNQKDWKPGGACIILMGNCRAMRHIFTFRGDI